jgi:putative tricarboxylic transport membrane protein
MRRANIAVAFLLIGLAGYLLFEGRALRFGTMRVPQTAFFPSVLAVLLLFFSLIALVLAFRQSETGPSPGKIETAGWFRIGATLATLVGFAAALESFGFLLSTFLLMMLLLRAIEAPPWSKVIVVALTTALAAYFLFDWLLGVPLPVGVLGF